MANTVPSIQQIAVEFLHRLIHDTPLGEVPALYVDIDPRNFRRGDTINLREEDPISGVAISRGMMSSRRVAVAMDRHAWVNIAGGRGLYDLGGAADKLAMQVLPSVPEKHTIVTVAQQDPVGMSASHIAVGGGLCIRMALYFDPVTYQELLYADMLFGFAYLRAVAPPHPRWPVYHLTPEDADMLDLLMEAKAQLVAELEYRRAA